MPHRRLRRSPAAGGPRSRSVPFTGRSPRMRWTADLTSVWVGTPARGTPSPTHRRSRPDDHDRRRTRRADLGLPGPRRPPRARRLVARRELPRRRADLPHGQPAPARTAHSCAHQAPAARALGHHPGADVPVGAPQPRHRPRRLRRALRHRPRARGPGRGGHGVPGGHVLGAVRARHGRRRGHEGAVPAVLLPRRHPQPRRAADPGLDPRGGRARLRALARLRRGLRQPGPAWSPA